MTTRQRWTMVAVILGSAIVFLDSSVVNLALPQIGEELPSSLFARLEAQSYVANGYFVTLSALLVLAGALADFYGRRRMYAIGLVGFGVTSLHPPQHAEILNVTSWVNVDKRDPLTRR